MHNEWGRRRVYEALGPRVVLAMGSQDVIRRAGMCARIVRGERRLVEGEKGGEGGSHTECSGEVGLHVCPNFLC